MAYKTQVLGHELTAWNYICDKCGSTLHAVPPSNWEAVFNGIDAACSAVNEKVEPFLKSLFKEVGVRGCVCEAGWIGGNIEIFPE